MTNASSLNLSELLLLPSIQLFKNYQGGNSPGFKDTHGWYISH